MIDPVVADAIGTMQLHHVGIVVREIEAAAQQYERLGFRDGERIEVPEQGIVAIVYPAGTGYVELIQPTDPEGAIGRYLAKRGEGSHHVAFAVPEIDAALRRLGDAGVRLIDERPRDGAHGWKIAFIHPESCNGVLTELVQV